MASKYDSFWHEFFQEHPVLKILDKVKEEGKVEFNVSNLLEIGQRHSYASWHEKLVFTQNGCTKIPEHAHMKSFIKFFNPRILEGKGLQVIIKPRNNLKNLALVFLGEKPNVIRTSKESYEIKQRANTNRINTNRIGIIANTFASLGWNGIIQFDLKEPEYQCFSKLKPKADYPYLSLMAVCTGIIDYQLAGNAYLFWKTLGEIAHNKKVESINTIKNTVYEFLDCPVNTRLNNQKRNCLNKIFSSFLPQKIISDYKLFREQPYLLWQDLSKVTGRKMEMKTIVMAMKVFDLVHLIYYDDYARFPEDIPIPVDIHVKRISYISGLIENEKVKDDVVRNVWGKICKKVSTILNKTVTSFRIDSSIWQIGKLASQSDWKLKPIVNYLTQEIGITRDKADKFSKELLWRRLNN
ncbi:N-glycosylase/DNA lyase [Candidatus Aerophobetes bacterium]|nr:N-glycosylase/DNA lyase [Candidatus Aerophobetes bacterium]